LHERKGVLSNKAKDIRLRKENVLQKDEQQSAMNELTF